MVTIVGTYKFLLYLYTFNFYNMDILCSYLVIMKKSNTDAKQSKLKYDIYIIKILMSRHIFY